jgi:hypothetical protein
MSNRGLQFLNNGGGGLIGYIHASEVLVAGMGGQPEIPINPTWFRHGAGVGLFVTLPDGSAANYDVEMTGARHDLRGDKPWNKHDVLYSKTTSAQSNLAYPCNGVRIFLRSLTGYLWFAVVTTEQG